MNDDDQTRPHDGTAPAADDTAFARLQAADPATGSAAPSPPRSGSLSPAIWRSTRSADADMNRVRWVASSFCATVWCDIGGAGSVARLATAATTARATTAAAPPSALRFMMTPSSSDPAQVSRPYDSRPGASTYASALRALHA